MTRPLVMGIINNTPDSFSGDGLLLSADPVAGALAQAERMLADGADILDIGGESTRPGFQPVPADEEIRRVVPVLSAFRKKFGSVPLAVDTVKADVAEQALAAGASIVNDVSGLAADPRMRKVAAQNEATVVIMHNKAALSSFAKDAKLGNSYDAPVYGNFFKEVLRDLGLLIAEALDAGIKREKIILDPGLGFGKTPQQNMELIARLDEIKALGFRVLVGPSRKSFIGQTLDLPVAERAEGTAACAAIAVWQGADILRVHDVKEIARTARMVSALSGMRRSEGSLSTL